MGKVYVVTSGKGGVGKSTSTANIGTALAKQNKNVLLVDLDIGLRNLDLLLGLENRIIFDIVDVVEGRCRLKQAVVRDKRTEHLSLLPASQSRDKSAVTEDQMRKLALELRELYDYIFLDCPAGIEQGFKTAVAAADHALIVCTPEVTSIRDADRIVGLLSGYDVESTHLIVNRYKGDLVKKGDMLAVSDIEEILGVKVMGVVPEDELIVRSGNLGEPAVNLYKSVSGREYKAIAERISEQKYFMPDVERRNTLKDLVARMLGLENRAG